MSDPSTDDKIAQLVHSVLEAVDLRLVDIRHELQVSAQETDRRIHEIHQELRDLSVHIDRLDSAQRRGAATQDLGEQQLTELRSGLARLQQQVGALQHSTSAPAAAAPLAVPVAPMAPTAPATHAQSPSARPSDPVPPLTPALPSFEQVAAPLVAPHLATPPPITTEIPRIDVATDITTEMPTIQLAAIKLATFEPVTTQIPVIPASGTAGAAADDTGGIDLDQLANLLNERLGHLDLPRAD